MTGETVVFELTGEAKEKDRFGAPIYETELVAVPGVLVAPQTSDDLPEDRPEGYRVLYTLYLPKTFDATLAKERVMVRGRWLKTIGFSDHYPGPDCPTRWWQVLRVGESIG